MSRLMRLLNPRKYRRQQEAARVQSLRTRDGDSCARCRRPLRFDLPAGHDLGAVVEGGPAGAGDPLAEARLCHRRCNSGVIDHTEEVAARMRRKAESALFAKSRKKRRAA